MSLRKFGRTILLVVAVLGLLAGARSILVPRKVAAQQGSSAPQTIYFVKDPEPTPTFQAKDLDGKVVSAADWKGKAVLLNFWATWCPPCRDEIPALMSLQIKYQGRLVVVGISEDDGSPDDVQKYAKKMGINYPVVMATPQIVASWGNIEALPTTFLVSSSGRVMGKNRGERRFEDYDREIKALLGEPVDARIETIADQGQVFLKNAANATELPDVSFAGLNADQKKAALHRLNAETCTCGCKLTISQCRLNDTTCPVSKTLAAQIVKDVQAASTKVKSITAN